MTLIYLVDCHYTIFNKYPPRVMSSEMIGDMPSSEEAYAATDALVCEGYLLGTNEAPRAALATSLEWLMGDEWNPVYHYGLTTLNLFTFLNCKQITHNYLYQTFANYISIEHNNLPVKIDVSLGL